MANPLSEADFSMANKPSLKMNVIANYLGSGWNSLMTFIFVPYYIKYLGMEAYGLIGFYTMLQATLMLLDAGMTPTLNREMARYCAGKNSGISIRNLLRTLEIICLIVAVVFYVLIYFSAEWVSINWLQAQNLSKEVIGQAFLLIGLVAALRFIEGLYRGAILGLQKQVAFNIIHAVMATLRGAGSVLILMFVSPTIKAYFVWQGIISFVTVIFFIYILYTSLPRTEENAAFCVNELRKIWRFALGVMATSALAIALTQIDKLILSKILSLENFGNYSLVVTMTSVLIMIIGPITQAHYPRISELVGQERLRDLKKCFHKGAQLASVFSSCAAFALVIYGERIVVLWTGNEELGKQILTLLRVMALGTFFNSLWHMPYILQLAYGWSSFAVKVNLVGVIFLVPAILYFTPVYGAIGAAWLWVMLNAGYVFIAPHFMFKKILQGEKGNWFFNDLFIPSFTALAVLYFFSELRPQSGKFFEAFYICISSFFALCISILVSKELKDSLIGALKNLKAKINSA